MLAGSNHGMFSRRVTFSMYTGPFVLLVLSLELYLLNSVDFIGTCQFLGGEVCKRISV